MTATAYTITCLFCERAATLAQPGRFCKASCRARFHRARLGEQRRRLAAEADAALASGDVAELERVARSAVALLAA